MRAMVVWYEGTPDVSTWKTWAFGASEDLTAIYGVGGEPPEQRRIVYGSAHRLVDYPPLAPMLLGAVGHLYRVFAPGFADTPALTILVKLPGLLWEALLVLVFLTWGRRRFGAEVASRLALVWWLNPAVVLNGSLFGYLDALVSVPAILALFAAWDGVLWLTFALALVAALSKAQAVFVVPVVALAVWRRGRFQRADWAAGVAVSLSILSLTVGPFLLRGAGPNLFAALESLTRDDRVSGNAANVWWIFGWIVDALRASAEHGWRQGLGWQPRVVRITDVVSLGYPSPRLVGSLVVAGLFAVGLWRGRILRTQADVAALAGWCVHAYVIFAAQVHENHLALALPFVTVAAALNGRWWTMGVVVSTMSGLNLLLFYGRQWFSILGYSRRAIGIDDTLLLACANIAAFVLYTKTLRQALSSTETDARNSADQGSS